MTKKTRRPCSFVRLVSSAEFGVFTIWNATTTVISAGAAQWLRQAVLRYSSRYQDDHARFLRTIWGLTALTCAVIAVAALSGSPFVMGKPFARLYVFGVLVIMLATVVKLTSAEITLEMSSDWLPASETVLLSPVASGGWGTEAWGDFPWGVSTIPEQVITTWPTKNMRYAHWIIINLALTQAFTALALDGMSCTFDIIGTRAH